MSTFSPLYTDLGGTHLDGDRLLQLCLLLHGEHTLPSWMKKLEPGQLNLLEIRLQPMPPVVLPDGRRWDLTAPLTGLCWAAWPLRHGILL